LKTIQLGHNGPVVSQVGLGCMAMSDMYGPSDESESIATIHAALDAGINMLDPEDLAQIERAIPADAVAGTRYAEEQMRWLDSEKPALQP
jgi:predicted oxidoreductase